MQLSDRMRAVIKLEVVFIVLATIAGLYFVFQVPLLWGYDESDHFARAYQISEGDLAPVKVDRHDYGGYLPKSYVGYVAATRTDLKDDVLYPIRGRTDVDQKQLYTTRASIGFSKAKAKYVFNGASAYSPVAYLPSLLGVIPAKALGMTMKDTILLARLTSLLCYVVIVAWSIRLLKDNAAKYVVFVVALFPMAIVQAATVNADNLLNALAFLLFAGIVRYWFAGAPSKKLYVGLIITATLLPLVKVSYIFLSLLTILLKPPKFKLRQAQILARPLAGILIIIPAVFWYLQTRGVSQSITNGSIYKSEHLVDPSRQLHFLLGHPLESVGTLFSTVMWNSDAYINTLIGHIANNYVDIPALFIAFAVSLLTLATVYVNANITKPAKKARLSRWMLLAGILTVLGVLGTLYLTFTPVGKDTIEGVNGRYFIPAVCFIAYGVAGLLPLKVKDQGPFKTLSVFSVGAVVLLITAAIMYTSQTY